MFQSIYSKPLLSIILAITIAVAVWGYLGTKVQLRRWTMANLMLACVAVIAILCATILTRTPGVSEAILTPFASLTAARQQPELYREMLMNVFLFFPLGPMRCRRSGTAGAESLLQHSSVASSVRELSTLSTATPSVWRRWMT